MKILILGGTGAMGVELVQALCEQGQEVYVTSRKKKVSDSLNLHYLQGDAHELSFLKEILNMRYDAIIDFMIYSTEQFKNNMNLLLNSTEQYIYLSSSRVYAESDNQITEKSPRILDVCVDDEYLKTDEYALAKARQENLLTTSKVKNWTIIRPYITYNSERLQLGHLEKEYWLYRALEGKSIVFFNDYLDKYTTMTHGYDVARVIIKLLGNKRALGEVIHIANDNSITWKKVLNIYSDVLEDLTGKKINIAYMNLSSFFSNRINKQYQIYYDRLYNRKFDSAKMKRICKSEIIYKSVQDGLEECLSDFVVNKYKFKRINSSWEGYADRMSGEKLHVHQFNNKKDKLRYLGNYFIPNIMRRIREYK